MISASVYHRHGALYFFFSIIAQLMFGYYRTRLWLHVIFYKRKSPGFPMLGIKNHPDSLVNLIIDMIENEAFWGYASKPRVK
jgi:hypothetical protein